MKSKSKRPKPLPYSKEEFKALSGLWKIDRVILDALNFEELANRVVNVVLEELDYLKLGYQIIVLTLIDKKSRDVKRISISKTKPAAKALEETPIPFKEIIIPLSATENLLVKAIKNKKIYFTHDLSDVLYPEANRKIWRQIQKVCEIKTSMIYPIVARGKTLGAMIFSLSKGADEISIYEKEILAGFTNAVGIAVEHVSLYRKLRKTNQRLKKVSALKDEFVSLASHELRTPLTAIAGSLSTILDGYAGKVDGQKQEFLQGAYNESNRLIRLVNNLLNISRIEAGRLKFELNSFELCKIIEEVVENLEAQAKEKAINLVFGCQKLQVLADQDKVREILVNLIGNALKFTDKGRVAVDAFRQDGLAVIVVEDTGNGILPEDQDKLFKKFERVDGVQASKQKGGAGLGLYICRNLLKGMAGEIWLKSAHGKGSTFFFTLPIAD